MLLLSFVFLIGVYLMVVLGDQTFRSTALKETVNYRLPNFTYPHSYDIALYTRVDQAKFEFSGQVNIGIVVDYSTSEIVLHAKQLNITSIRLARYSGTVPIDIRLLPHTYDVYTEFLRISTDGPLLIAGDRLLLQISYAGILRTDKGGFYRTSYVNVNGERKWLAVTQFAPTDARHAFPCYDEPARKAKFRIQITHGEQFRAISNMPETRFKNTDDTATTVFTETPLMSTYLVAFVVSDLSNVTNGPTDFPHRVFMQAKDVGSTEFALGHGEVILYGLQDYLRVNYSLPKMDQVAVPDMYFGAMENWGLVTYREDILVWNEYRHSQSRQLNLLITISHEFGHQWFGNLVSPQQWMYVWLNEGLATLFGYIGTNLIYPEWNVFDFFVTNDLQKVLKIDSKYDSHEMSRYVDSPEMIAQIYDKIAYEKAGSVLRMFLHACTEDSFRKGLTYYLTERSYKSAVEQDLFDALAKSVEEDRSLNDTVSFVDAFSSWSQQKGYPVLIVERDYNKRTAVLKQRRYLTPKGVIKDNSSWWIPYNYASALNPNFATTTTMGWLTPNEKSKIIGVESSSSEWLVFNKQQTGYYRVLYDEHNFQLLTKQLSNDTFTVIHWLNRAQLLDDSFEFAEQSVMKMSAFFRMFSYLQRETEYAPWKVASDIVDKCSRLLSGTAFYSKFQVFIAELLEEPYRAIGVENHWNEPILKKFSRTIIVKLACKFGVESCLRATHLQLKLVLFNNQILHPDVQGFVYANGIRNATDNEVDRVWSYLSQAREKDERLAIISGFGLVRNHDLLEKYINKTIHDDKTSELSKRERVALFNSIAERDEYGLALAINLIEQNPIAAKENLEDLDISVQSLAARVTTFEARVKFDNLMTSLRKSGLILNATATEVETLIRGNYEWISAHGEAIKNWLDNPNSGSSTSCVSLSMTILFTSCMLSSKVFLFPQ